MTVSPTARGCRTRTAPTPSCGDWPGAIWPTGFSGAFRLFPTRPSGRTTLGTAGCRRRRPRVRACSRPGSLVGRATRWWTPGWRSSGGRAGCRITCGTSSRSSLWSTFDSTGSEHTRCQSEPTAVASVHATVRFVLNHARCDRIAIAGTASGGFTTRCSTPTSRSTRTCGKTEATAGAISGTSVRAPLTEPPRRAVSVLKLWPRLLTRATAYSCNCYG